MPLWAEIGRRKKQIFVLSLLTVKIDVFFKMCLEWKMQPDIIADNTTKLPMLFFELRFFFEFFHPELKRSNT